ncbi:MAG: malto-oligosyltrehalose synthase [Anaerolineae bacterium]|nr:malto-oligosyltrehalose synthase [Anaerolineae bacterium]
MAELQRLVEQTAQELIAKRHIPRATYRVQFNAQFTFKDAEALIPYLHDLGISDVYASPILKAFPGSNHGYDICDHSQLNPELGTHADFDRFSAALQARDMWLIVDVVPNHMGIAENCNAWWNDVLENGRSSAYANYFDIDWTPVKPELVGKVLIPILGDQYGQVLEAGQIQLAYQEGAFCLRYGAHELPLAPGTYSLILEPPAAALTALLGATAEPVIELQSILTAINYLPGRSEVDAAKITERMREKEVIKRRIAALYSTTPEVQTAFSDTISRLNGVVGDPHSFDQLDDLISAQPYRMAYWRVAAEEINYRRFFDINTMAAIRVELPEVFDDTHALIFELVAKGQVSGLRIDHPDGLWNPPEYFRRLQERYITEMVLRQDSALDRADVETAVSAWFAAYQADQSEVRDYPLYVVVEKILSEKEPLPRNWAVYGTTGYDFMNLVNGVFVDSRAEAAMTEIYGGFAGSTRPFADMEGDSKRKIMQEALSSEVNSLAHQLERLSEQNRHTRDFTLNGLRHALREIMASLSIYRTYINTDDDVAERDRHFLDEAVRDAKRRNPGVFASVFDFIRDTLLLRISEEYDDDLVRFVMRFQQITSPVMAKSIEDTLFYVYNRLVSLNEVGGSPANYGLSLEELHAQNIKRCKLWRYAMLSTSTHDTKRSADVRARLNVLSEIPREWERMLAEWRALNADDKIDGLPDANDEYLLYQSLIGAWPQALTSADDWQTFCERMCAYMAKATKEAKVHTSWTNADEAYDAALRDFVVAVLRDGEASPFVQAFLPFQRRVAYFGWFNTLSQELLKLTCPGVPDTYRGTESWDFSLVDPDNRRPVDYDRYRTILNEVKQLGVPSADLVHDVRIKLFIVQAVLNFRREHPGYFGESDYEPIAVEGAKADHVIAFRRIYQGKGILVIVPRLLVGLTDGQERPPTGDVWGDTRITVEGGSYRNVFTGEMIDGGQVVLSQALRYFPIGLFEPS